MKTKTWASSKKFFQGLGERPITENEKAAVYILAGATLMVVAIRLYQYFALLFR